MECFGHYVNHVVMLVYIASLHLRTKTYQIELMVHFLNDILMQRVCNDACVGGPTDIISPVYSLWATFIGLYIANYVVERSTGYAILSCFLLDLLVVMSSA